MVNSFSEYLRNNLSSLEESGLISFETELSHIKTYLEIEKVRFEDTLEIEYDIKCDRFSLPVLTVQPIVENAIKHGLMRLESGGTVLVRSYETPTHFCVEVKDDGVGFDTSLLLDERKHVGLRNIRERLKVMVNGRLEIESTVGVGTRVLVSIPREDKE